MLDVHISSQRTGLIQPNNTSCNHMALLLCHIISVCQFSTLCPVFISVCLLCSLIPPPLYTMLGLNTLNLEVGDKRQDILIAWSLSGVFETCWLLLKTTIQTNEVAVCLHVSPECYSNMFESEIDSRTQNDMQWNACIRRKHFWDCDGSEAGAHTFKQTVLWCTWASKTKRKEWVRVFQYEANWD